MHKLDVSINWVGFPGEKSRSLWYSLIITFLWGDFLFSLPLSISFRHRTHPLSLSNTHSLCLSLTHTHVFTHPHNMQDERNFSLNYFETTLSQLSDFHIRMCFVVEILNWSLSTLSPTLEFCLNNVSIEKDQISFIWSVHKLNWMLQRFVVYLSLFLAYGWNFLFVLNTNSKCLK